MAKNLFSKDTQKAVDELLSGESKPIEPLYPLGTIVKYCALHGFYLRADISQGKKCHWVCMYITDDTNNVVTMSYYECVADEKSNDLIASSKTTKIPISADGYLIEPGYKISYNFKGHVASTRYPLVTVIASAYGTNVLVRQQFETKESVYMVVPSNRLLQKEI